MIGSMSWYWKKSWVIVVEARPEQTIEWVAKKEPHVPQVVALFWANFQNLALLTPPQPSVTFTFVFWSRTRVVVFNRFQYSGCRKAVQKDDKVIKYVKIWESLRKFEKVCYKLKMFEELCRKYVKKLKKLRKFQKVYQKIEKFLKPKKTKN